MVYAWVSKTHGALNLVEVRLLSSAPVLYPFFDIRYVNGISMRPEIYQSSTEKWFNRNLPIPDQSRLVVGTFDIDIKRLELLREGLKSTGLGVWSIPEGAYSTIYFWSPVDEELSTRIRARWYTKPAELESLGSTDRVSINPNQSTLLEVKVTFPLENGKEYEIKYRQRSSINTVLRVSQNLRMATDILNSAEHILMAPFISKIPQEVFSAIGERHPSGLVPTVMVSAIREHFVVDDNSPDDFRVTVDYNYKYHSFWSMPPWEAENIGGYPYLRTEVKVGDEKFLGKAEDVINIVRREGGFPPEVTKHADKTFINHKYSTNGS